MTSTPLPDTSLVAHADALADIVDQVGRSVLAFPGRHRHGLASGVVWQAGLVVTVAHVFRRTPAAWTLVGAGGETHEATLVGIDSSTDLALFRLADSSLPAATLGDAAAVRAGHLAIAVGRSASGDLDASHGMVSRSGGPWQTWLGGRLERQIRLDGGLYDGLSGGAIANAAGAVIGIGSSALSRSHGIAIPASTVTAVVEALLARGHVARAFLGLGAQPVSVPVAATAEAAGDKAASQGLLVSSLVPGGPAATAGVLIGDIVVAVDGQPAASLHDLRHALAGRIGSAVPLALIRGGVPVELQVTVAQWPTEARRC